jgi:hypothetical protein
MHLSVRSTLAAGCVAAVVAAGAVGVGPESVASGPRSLTASVSLAAHAGTVFNTFGHLFDANTLVSYIPIDPQVSESVSHVLGLVPQLLGDVRNPPILKAVLGQQLGTVAAVAPQLIADLAAFGSYTGAAAAVVGQVVTIAIRDTATPAGWGAGNVLWDWADVGFAVQAMTIGIGARVDGVWVPSLRVAAISTRNQIANDIASGPTTTVVAGSAHPLSPQASQVILETTLPNYANDYEPEDCNPAKCGTSGMVVVETTPDGCGTGSYCRVRAPLAAVDPAASKPLATKTVRSRVSATPKAAAAARKAVSARTRFAK